MTSFFGRAFGVAGIIWGTVIAHVVCSAIPTVIYLSSFLRRLQRLPLTAPDATA